MFIYVNITMYEKCLINIKQISWIHIENKSIEFNNGLYLKLCYEDDIEMIIKYLEENNLIIKE